MCCDRREIHCHGSRALPNPVVTWLNSDSCMYLGRAARRVNLTPCPIISCQTRDGNFNPNVSHLFSAKSGYHFSVVCR